MMQTEIPQPKLHNGMRSYELFSCQTTSHLTTAILNDKEKLVYPDATFVIDLITDSWKYGCELQFNCWSRKAPKVALRTKEDSAFYRCEIGYLPGTHETADKLREIANQIDVIVGYEPVTFTVEDRSTVRVLDKDFRLEDVLL
jgi:hypothetical protein